MLYKAVSNSLYSPPPSHNYPHNFQHSVKNPSELFFLRSLPVFTWIFPLIPVTSGWYVGIFEFISHLNIGGLVNLLVFDF